MILNVEVRKERRTALISAAVTVKKLKDAGVLRVIREASGSRPAVLALGELVNQAEGRKVL